MAIANGLAERGHQITLAGSGEQRTGSKYEFVNLPCVNRSVFRKFPSFPAFRDDTSYEEFSFLPGLLSFYRPRNYDLTVSCSYPFSNWALRRPVWRGQRPPHVFITENGDWPAHAQNSEYRLFGCEGLVCINPDFYEQNKDRWFCSLIPNGVHTERFISARGNRKEFGIPEGRRVVLMVSALSATKRVDVALDAIALVPDVHLVVAGDGPDKDQIHAKANQLLPGRFTNLTVRADKMPSLYHSADLLLHMSLAESFGNVFVEATACGLPVIAHDISRHGWALGGQGILVDTTDVKKVANAVRLAKSATFEERKAREKVAETFDWKHIALKYETFFEQVISRAT